MHGRVLQRTQDFDTAIEIARHHVGRRDIYRGLRAWQAMAHAEAIDAAMFEETADNRLDADILRQAGHARPQAADTTNDQLDGDTRPRCLIERIDDAGIDQRIHLEPDRARLARACE